MTPESKKNPQNVPGKYYVTEDCVACEACQYVAPNNFRYDDQLLSFVFKQPDTPAEVEQCEKAVEGCPMEAVRNDGNSEPIVSKTDDSELRPSLFSGSGE